jgi:hypothetical protein
MGACGEQRSVFEANSALRLISEWIKRKRVNAG